MFTYSDYYLRLLTADCRLPTGIATLQAGSSLSRHTMSGLNARPSTAYFLTSTANPGRRAVTLSSYIASQTMAGIE